MVFKYSVFFIKMRARDCSSYNYKNMKNIKNVNEELLCTKPDCFTFLQETHISNEHEFLCLNIYNPVLRRSQPIRNSNIKLWRSCTEATVLLAAAFVDVKC